MSNIKAQKNGQFKEFTKYAWDLMGPDKNGWTEVVEKSHPVTNTAIETPETGELKKEIDNSSIPNEAVKPVVVTEVTNTAIETPETGENTDFKKLAIDNLKASRIKDYFDAKEIKYKQNLKLDGLVELLAENLKGDINLLKAEFSI